MKEISPEQLKELGFCFPKDDAPNVAFLSGYLFYVGYNTFKYFIGYTPLDQYSVKDFDELKTLLNTAVERVEEYAKQTVEYYKNNPL